MIFSTTIFVFLFLPLFLVCYYLLPFSRRSGWILVGSWIFYAWWRLDFLGLMIAATVWSYLAGTWIARHRKRHPRRASAALALGLVLNLGILAYFKYFNFGIESLDQALDLLGFGRLQAWRVILPIGISFYVFQACSYLIDVYRGDAPAAASYVELAAYISLFPQLIAGPILRYKDLADQFRSRSHRFQKFSAGAYRFMTGFCKKVLIADSVALIADTVFAMQQPGFVPAWLGALAYTSQLYFDFTGYSDMAIGLGLMMGFRFMENFNHPYISRSITEFWRRWHISLSTWLRDYLYIPLGGNRRGRRRTYVNILLVMLLGGLWHGAAWTFVIWGAWHGAILVLERLLNQRSGGPNAQRVLRQDAASSDALPAVSPAALPGPPANALMGALAVARTMLLVIVGWVIFRAPDFAAALAMYRGMIGLNGAGLYGQLAWQFSGVSLAILAVSFVIVCVEPFVARIERGLPQVTLRSLAPARIALYGLFLLAIARLQAEAFSPFLYFQF